MVLQHNTTLITGGSSGIGLELAGRLIEKRNKVLICGRSKDKLEKAKKKHPEIEIFQCDLSKSDESYRLARWVTEKYPECNILINNAALVHVDDFYHGENMIEKAHIEFQTNVLAPIALVKLLIPVLEKNRDPKLINITTGLVYAPKAAYPFYNAAKAALHSFTQVLRIQMEQSDIEIIETQFPAVDTPWHKGNVPEIAISVEQAVDEMIEGLKKEKKEIRIAKVKLIYLISRIAPKFAIKKINSIKNNNLTTTSIV